MNKDEFMKRARMFASAIPNKEQYEQELKDLEIRREQHLSEVAQFDAEAAKLERKFLELDSARAEAELVVASHYASRLEDN